MKVLVTLSCLLMALAIGGCDMRSQTAKDEMDKFSGTPTPTFSPKPAETPIPAADIVQVDMSVEGDPISVQGPEPPKNAGCPKFNRLKVNGSGKVLTIKGPCRQLMVNGDNNVITVDAAMEFVLNGSGNNIKYSRFVNGKRPTVADNGPDNNIEKISSDAVTASPSNRSIVK